VGRILADKAHLQQVLMNLLTNSMHAMPEGGTIIVETRLAAHPENEPGEWVLLSVRDTGIGMDQETLAHVFDPFYTTRRDGKGTGLGLSIVYGIVRQSGGCIDVESTPGVGTTFRIWWKRAVEAANQKLETAPPREARAGSELILLVEDRDEVRKLMKAMLERAGYRVLSAASGDDAMEVAAESTEHIDLLLTDVVMPGMNGRDLAERLTAKDPELRVIFMSGFAAEVIRPESARNAGFAFLQKPITAEALTSKLREVLDGNWVTA
jgi:CheY-like chemotaxis protein